MPLDTHVHLASDDPAAYPLAEAPPIETEGYVNTAEELLARMDEAGVEAATVVQPFALYAYDNAYHLDSAAKHAGRFAAVVGLSTTLPGVPGILRQLVTERGAAGIRLNTRNGDTDFENPQFVPLMEEAARLGVPVCFLTSRRYLPGIRDIALRIPDVRIACDHLGVQLGDPEKVLDAVMGLVDVPNVVLKFSTPLFVAGGPHLTMFRQIVERFGVDRLMWGTNYPVTNEGGYKNTVDIVRKGLDSYSAAEQQAMFHGTALRFWPQLSGAFASA